MFLTQGRVRPPAPGPVEWQGLREGCEQNVLEGPGQPPRLPPVLPGQVPGLQPGGMATWLHPSHRRFSAPGKSSPRQGPTPQTPTSTGASSVPRVWGSQKDLSMHLMRLQFSSIISHPLTCSTYFMPLPGKPGACLLGRRLALDCARPGNCLDKRPLCFPAPRPVPGLSLARFITESLLLGARPWQTGHKGPTPTCQPCRLTAVPSSPHPSPPRPPAAPGAPGVPSSVPHRACWPVLTRGQLRALPGPTHARLLFPR